MNWNEIFEYRDGELYWKIDPCKYLKLRGKKVGGVGSGGYKICSYKNKNYYIHRIIWELNYGSIPNKYQIDHIDGNKANNEIKNLRVVTHQGNALNAPKRSDNTSGCVGVYWSDEKNKWYARIRFSGVDYNLGYFKFKEEAIKVRKNAEKKYGFHPNYGRETVLS